MTLLALDVGNAETVMGFFDGEDLVAQFQVSSLERRTADEWYLLVDGFADRVDIAGIDEIAVCATVPAILEQLRVCFTRYFTDAAVWIVGPGTRTGVAIHTDNPREVGADRIVNALAAAEVFGGPAIVVDLTGTATVFDAIDESGTYLGGAIAPGLEVSLEALASRSAQLRSVEVARPRHAIGKNTVEAILAGTVYGFAGLVDAVVARMIEALGADVADVAVIATGAHAAAVSGHCHSITAHDSDLTLTGLRLVAERNR